jgi:HK97 gp10 family phage protein
MVTMKIEGGKELEIALRSLPPTVMRKVDRQGLREGGKIVLEKAQRDCPVVSGALRDSLKLKAGKRRKNYISVVIGTAIGWFKGKTYYGGFVEFGTSKMGARPFVRPAFDTQKEYILDRIISSLNSALIKVWMNKSGTAD